MNITTKLTACFLTLLSGGILAEEVQPPQPPTSPTTFVGARSGFTLLLGYRSVPLKESFSHNTHPDDGFLPNARQAGSAGTTSLGRAQFIEFGGRYEFSMNDRWSFNLDAAGLFGFSSGNGADAGGMNLVDRKNANDSRPASNAAFIYTDSNYGFGLSVGTKYDFNKTFYVGDVVDLTGVFIDHGWDRFGTFTSQSSKFAVVVSGGPKVGFRFGEGAAFEATVLAGQNGIGCKAGFVWKF